MSDETSHQLLYNTLNIMSIVKHDATQIENEFSQAFDFVSSNSIAFFIWTSRVNRFISLTQL